MICRRRETMEPQVQHDESARKYFLLEDSDEAQLLYVPAGEGIVELTHTYVPPEMRGKGLGERLVRFALEDIRRRGERFIPTCPFVAKYVESHPEWRDNMAERA
jgi:predicted GNAT family acetyltransferase